MLRGADGGRYRLLQAPDRGAPPGTCAWYGSDAGGTLFFGRSAFWHASRARGGPEGGLEVEGTPRIGRFALAEERFLPPLELPAARGAGTWDVLQQGDRLFYTTFFGLAGVVELPQAAARPLEALGRGLNELAAGPDGSILASRYGAEGGGPGALVWFGPDGAPRGEIALEADPGLVAAPKTPAFDPTRRELWTTLDLVPGGEGPVRQEARRLDLDGRLRERIVTPEIQFVRFTPEGTGLFAVRQGARLALRILDPGAAGTFLEATRSIELDPRFPVGLDFAQDLVATPDGRVLVTRWSGRVHLVDPATGSVRDHDFPRPGGRGLYYSAVLSEGRICATFCREVEVVCTDVR